MDNIIKDFINKNDCAELLHDIYHSDFIEKMFWEDLEEKFKEKGYKCNYSETHRNKYRGLEIEKNSKSLYILRDDNLFYSDPSNTINLQESDNWKYSSVKINFTNKEIVFGRKKEDKYKFFQLLDSNTRNNIINQTVWIHQ
jgi:hypothetical protein